MGSRPETLGALLDRTILGPRMTPFVTIPVVGGDLWVRTGLVAEYPFFIRETPGR